MRPALILLAAACLAPAAIADDDTAFRSAQPVWPDGRQEEMNLMVGFRAKLTRPEAKPAVLRVAAATIYRVSVNGDFVGHGPARAAHGYYRVDEWDLTPRLRPGENVVAIEVAGYNVNSYYVLDQPSFLQAEVVSGDDVLASTGGAGARFEAGILEYRVQKVQRYSFQRPFIEVYRLAPGFDQWKREAAASLAGVSLAVQSDKANLPRGVPYPDFALRKPVGLLGRGRMEAAEPKQLWKDRSLVNIGDKLQGYPEGELAVIPTIEAQRLVSVPAAESEAANPEEAIRLGKGEYRIVDLGLNASGFLGATITAEEKTRLWFVFDEVLTENDVDFKRLGCANIVEYQLEPGTYQVESIEPYTLRYLKLVCLEGRSTVKDVFLREYSHPAVAATFRSSDERLNRLFAAGVETYRQNAVDIFMDCPSRERAGWLCDSFFTARVERDLTGGSPIERNFLENYRLPERFEHLPEGMLPMCYPADHNDGVFIPNWAMWFVVQLEEFAARGGDRATIDALRPKVLKLLDYLGGFENSDGLLEKLPSWVFVEWSEANKFVQDVNYPSNMLYAGALSSAGRVYGMPELIEKAGGVRETVRQQSFDGEFFVDNAVRRDGKLEVTRNRTEVCQYFAFFFDVASPTTHGELWKRLRDQFGPHRQETKAFAEVHPANSFIGNMLRMELLSRNGRGQQILDESIAYLLYMADRTGTLWENVGAYASCNHGFASHICHTLYRDVLGVYRWDRAKKHVSLRLADIDLDWCEGSLPTPEGAIRLRWEKHGETLTYQVQLPPGYTVDVKNLSGKTLEEAR